MPRLEGERSGGSIITIVLIVVAVLVALLLLEFFNVINLIATFP